jgi:hypothetical protein
VHLLIRRSIAACLSLALTAAAGCETSPIYTDGDRRHAIGSVPDRANWTASGTVKDPGSAIDGSLYTAAVAPERAENAMLTIDLHRPSMLNMVVVDHGRSELGFARQVVVETSLDGARFTPRHTAFGTRRVSSFLLLTPVLARYIRLRAIVPGDRPWSLAEIHVQ